MITSFEKTQVPAMGGVQKSRSQPGPGLDIFIAKFMQSHPPTGERSDEHLAILQPNTDGLGFQFYEYSTYFE